MARISYTSFGEDGQPHTVQVTDFVADIRRQSELYLNSDSRKQFCIWLRDMLRQLSHDDAAPSAIAAVLDACADDSCRLPISEVSELIHHRSRTVRASLAVNLSIMVDPRDDREVADCYITLARDPSPLVREWAVFKLGQVLENTGPMVEDVIRAALRDPDPRVRSEARASSILNPNGGSHDR